mmetsp:Transcript_116860/g.372001  ORF Transcript_116860/g.372001 Transcript_116860/m.372001 type:complete len:258 (+) Transcript_116860:2048-2821(+)
MHIQKELDALGPTALGHVSQVLLQGVDNRMYDRVRIMPNPIWIHTGQRTPGIAMHHAIHIDHGHHMEDVGLPQLSCNCRGAQDELQEALHRPRPHDFARVLPSYDGNRRAWTAWPSSLKTFCANRRRRSCNRSWPAFEAIADNVRRHRNVLRDDQGWHWQLPNGATQFGALEMSPCMSMPMQLAKKPRHHGVAVRGIRSEVNLVIQLRHIVRKRQCVQVGLDGFVAVFPPKLRWQVAVCNVRNILARKGLPTLIPPQ